MADRAPQHQEQDLIYDFRRMTTAHRHVMAAIARALREQETFAEEQDNRLPDGVIRLKRPA
jgi:hypothetical protein